MPTHRKQGMNAPESHVGQGRVGGWAGLGAGQGSGPNEIPRKIFRRCCEWRALVVDADLLLVSKFLLVLVNLSECVEFCRIC